MSSNPDPAQEREQSDDPSPHPGLTVERAPTLISSLQKTIFTLKNPETDIQKFDVEVGIVTAFICNLERKGDGDYEDEIYDLLVELREVADNVESKMRAIWKGLGYQGNHMNVASTAKDNQDNR